MRKRTPPTRLFASLILLASLAWTSPAWGLDWPLDEPLPVDELITVGKLDNGLTYYIRENDEPEGRGIFRLVVNAGSLQEDEGQRGLAHFVEHMAFNGTRRFEKQEIVRFLESIGMRFGADLNAYTSYNETVYMLELPMDDPETLVRGFQILEDWASGISFDPFEVERERGVVIEEWRSRQGAGSRLQDRQRPLTYYKSRYADRLPIGSMVVVRNAPAQRLIDFYNAWYRPNLMAVIAVGDFEADRIEALIKEHFAHLVNPPDAPERKTYEIPDHEQTLFSIETDPELTYASAQILYKAEPDPEGTARQYRDMLIKRLFAAMFNDRLAERAREADPPYLSASVGQVPLGREKQAYTQSVVFIGDNYQRGLSALMAETSRVKRDGFEASELERAKADQLRMVQSVYDERENTDSNALAAEFTRAFLTGEPIPGIAMELEMTKAFMKDITLEEVNAVARHYGGERNRVIHFSAPESDEFEVPTEEELLAAIKAGLGMELPPYVDVVDDGPLLEEVPEGGEIVEETYRESLDVHEWRLSNGIRVVAKKTDFRNDEILIESFSPGGHSLVADDEYVAAITSTMVLGESGMGEFDSIRLEKKLAGKSLSLSPYLDSQYEGINGSASPKDLELFFQLLYLQVMESRLDYDAFESLRSRLYAMVENRLKSPQAVFQDAIEEKLYGDHPRHRPMSDKIIEEMDPRLSLAIFENRFADFSDFTFVIVGALDIEELKELTRVYLGSLPSKNREEEGRMASGTPAGGRLELNVNRGLELKTTVRAIFTGEAEWSPENRYALAVVNDLLRIRMREALREEQGGTYGVGVFGSLSREPVERYTTGVGFTCDPENVETLWKAAKSEIEDLQQNGPEADRLSRVKEIHRRSREKSAKENSYWVNTMVSLLKEGRELEEINRFDELVESVTEEDVQRAAREYFSFDNLLFARLNPETFAK